MSEAPSLPPMDDVDKEALDRGAVVRPLSAGEGGHLQLVGSDGIGFLHRMTTSHVEGLGVGESQLTCFPDKRGRVVAAAVVLRTGAEEAHVVGRYDAAALGAWIDQFLFAEELEASVVAGSGLELTGAGALRVAGALSPRFEGLGPFQAARDDGLVAFRWFDALAPSGARVPRVLVLAEGRTAEAVSELEAIAVDRGAHRSTREVLEAARIAAGAPEAPAELSDKHNPLELALHGALHWDKGCYIGQEVISRIDNYGKQARHLVGLELDDRTRRVPEGAKVVVDGAEVGLVTSASTLDIGTGPTALALVRGEPRTGERVAVETPSGLVGALVVGRAAAQPPHD